MTQGNIYLDFNATTPIDPSVLGKVPEWLALWGNPSSIHKHGRGPKRLMRESRRSLAKTLGCHPLELIFTSGGSEANNLAIKGCLLEIKKREPQKTKVLMGSIEHPSVLKQKSWLEEQGFQVSLIPVDSRGFYDLDFFKQHLDESVALVSVMLANNEVGVIAPIQEMAEKAHQVGAFFHSDLVQALGKSDFNLQELGVDMASFSSHKIYALKGCGLLFVKKRTPFASLTQGGAQERGRRAGTENLAAIASFSMMVEQMKPGAFADRLEPLRDHMEAKLSEQIPGFQVLASKAPRLANTSTFLIEGVTGESLLMNLDIRGFSVGTGAACSSGNPEPSPVLLALGLSRDEAQSSLRISLGQTTTPEQVDQFIETLVQVVHHLRSLDMETGEMHV